MIPIRKIVLLEESKPLVSEAEPDLKRFTDAELAAEVLAPDPSARSPFANPIPLTPGQTPRAAGVHPRKREAPCVAAGPPRRLSI